MARVGFSSLNVNQMAGNKGMIAVCLRSRQQERSRNGPLDLVETHNNQQLQRQQRPVPLRLSSQLTIRVTFHTIGSTNASFKSRRRDTDKEGSTPSHEVWVKPRNTDMSKKVEV